MAKDKSQDQPQDQTPEGFGAPAPELGEVPAPVPAQTTRDVPQDNNRQAPLPRVDTGEVQPPPVLTPRTVVLDPTPPPVQEQTVTEATMQVATVPSGGLVELARILYGDVTRATEIANLNKDKVVNPDAIIVGTVVRVLPK